MAGDHRREPIIRRKSDAPSGARKWTTRQGPIDPILIERERERVLDDDLDREEPPQAPRPHPRQQSLPGLDVSFKVAITAAVSRNIFTRKACNQTLCARIIAYRIGPAIKSRFNLVGDFSLARSRARAWFD